ncbi:MAG: DUF4279 domain-containing protein [Chloroflexota bacterium]
MSNLLSIRGTPYDDEYATCEFTYAKLRVYPGKLDPMSVTQYLGITPTSTMTEGEHIVNSLGRERIVPQNGWFLSSEGQVSSKDVRRHLDWLLDRLEPISERLKGLQEQPEVKMYIVCIWWSAYGQGGPTLWPEQMKRMAEMNLECGFDIYFFGDEEEDAGSQMTGG